MEQKQPTSVTLVQMMGPTEANILGNVHGGILMKMCDEAGALAAMRYANRPTVTVTVDGMKFMSPVKIGNLVTVKATVTWVGRTSIETEVLVTAEDVLTGEVTHTNQAYFVYVALDEKGRPVQLPSLLCDTASAQAKYDRAEKRRALRLKLKNEGG